MLFIYKKKFIMKQHETELDKFVVIKALSKYANAELMSCLLWTRVYLRWHTGHMERYKGRFISYHPKNKPRENV